MTQGAWKGSSFLLKGLFIFINRVKNFFKNVIIAANLCNNNFFCKYIGINTESILFKFPYGIKKFKLRMISSKNINDLLVNFNPKILRFTGEKFPSELWNNIPVKNVKNNISSK